MGRLKKLASEGLDLAVLLVSDAIDSWSSGESRSALLGRLQEAVQRGGELALRVASLEDEVDGLRFNGPTLYRDEVEMLQWVVRQLNLSVATELTTDLDRDRSLLKAATELLNRCDHMPMTSDEFAKMADDAIHGRSKTFDWNDIGKDIDDE